MQTEVDEDNPVPDQTEETPEAGTVSLRCSTIQGFSKMSDTYDFNENPNRPNLVPIKKKLENRENRRESRALTAARLEKTLEKELVSRLKSRAYGDMPLNVNEEVWRAVLEGERQQAGEEAEGERERELEELGLEADETDEDDEDDEEGEDEEEREFISDLEDSELEDEMEDWPEGAYDEEVSAGPWFS